MASGSRENPLQLAQFPFSAGLDEGTRDEVVEAGSGWLVLENGRQDQVGGYSTRSGFSALSNFHIFSSTPLVGYKLMSDGHSPVRICDSQIEAYSSAAGRWQQLGTVSECAVTMTPALSVDASSSVEDIEATNGFLAVSWLKIVNDPLTPTATSWLAVLDQKTGSVVRIPEKVSTSTTYATPMLLTSVGNSFIAVRANTGSKIEGWALDTTSPATILAGWVAFGSSLATDAQGAFVVHAVPSVATPRFALLYVNTSGGASQLTLKTFDATGTLVSGQSTTINTSSVQPEAVAMAGNATDTLWTAWSEAGAVKVCGFSPTSVATTPLATTATIVTLSSFSGALGIAPGFLAGTARLWANDTNAATCGQMRGVKTTAGAAATDGSQIRVPAVLLRSKPFTYGSRYYGMFSGGDPNQSTQTQQNMILCDWTADDTWLRPVGNAAPGLATSGYNHIGKVIAGSVSTQFYTAINVQRSTVAAGSAIVGFDFASTTRWQPCAWGNSVYLTGGVPCCYDGASVAEIGFLIRPPKPTGTQSATGLTGTYRYIFVYEDVDADGNWHQSGTSDPSDVITVANKTITITSQPLTITARRKSGHSSTDGAVRIAIYRTIAGAVAPYYRLTTIANDTSSLTATYVDTTGDTTLSANAKLYEQPGVVGTSQDKRPPPFFSCMTSYNGCLVGASGSDVWYSGQNVSGEGVWFNPVFQVPVPGDGDITALWVEDGTLFVAKRREIYAIAGEAPSDNGASGGLGLPRRLAVDVGCIEPRSVCVTAFGTFFQSDRGIEILTRAQSVQWIGQPVQETLATFPIVTSATVEPVDCVVYVECAASEASGVVTGSGRTLVFDLSLQKWVSTDRRTSSAGTANAPSQSACMIYTGTDYRYAWLATDGVVHYGNDTHLDADGSMVAKRAVSANVRLSGLQGLQHVNKTLLLAKYHTPHDLQMSFAYDYSSTYTTARLYTAAQLAALAAVLPNMQLQDDMSNDARCEAVRVQLQDATPSSGTLGTGQGSTWIALSLEIVPQTGAYQLPDASR